MSKFGEGVIDPRARWHLLPEMVRRFARTFALGTLCLSACDAPLEQQTRVCFVPEELDTSIMVAADDEQVEALRGCRIIEATLSIGSAVTSLEPLHQLEQVDALWIRGNEELVDLRGLESLRLADALKLSDNTALETLDGLGAMIGLTEVLVEDNPQLRSLAGLAGLQLSAFEERSKPKINIERNPMLTELDGLASLLSNSARPTVVIRSEQPLDLAPLAARSDYEGLGLAGPSLRNFEALAQLRSARSISFYETALRDLQPLRGLESLESLSVNTSEAFESLAGLDPELGVERLSLSGLPALTSPPDTPLSVSFELRLEQLPGLVDASALQLRPDPLDALTILRVEDCASLSTLPQFVGGDRLGHLELRGTGLTHLSELASVVEVEWSTVIWDNPLLDQGLAEAWAAQHTTPFTRIGQNLGWVEPAECPWLEDGYCDAPSYCADDWVDCQPPPQGS